MARSSSLQLPSLGMSTMSTHSPSLIGNHSWLDGKHVVFGEVVEGYDIVEKIEDVPKGQGDKPSKTIKIAKSGELNKPEEGTHAEL